MNIIIGATVIIAIIFCYSAGSGYIKAIMIVNTEINRLNKENKAINKQIEKVKYITGRKKIIKTAERIFITIVGMIASTPVILLVTPVKMALDINNLYDLLTFKSYREG